ncbi:MAG: VCBS repeat-containing protein [Saprospiraceae bacterium]|nr:VCBS repeat-containing protein [Saprospiraceae bacterium]
MKKYWGLFFLLILFSCKKQDKTEAMFTLLTGDQTGLDFENKLDLTTQMNIFKYMYFYNGGGVGIADFNNDGKKDIFFTGNMVENEMFINEGNFKFKDVTNKAGIKKDASWSNGVSVVDINNDGMMDIYISQVSAFDMFKGHNQLYVCKTIENGIPVYEEQSAQYGLDLVGYGTQAVFFDYDLDGDLDMYQLNHSTHNNGTFGQRSSFLGTFHEQSGDKLMRNDNNHFTDVTKTSGIHSTVIGYGLGVVASDVNLDGYPDLYIGNDFHENDYLYINQKNGTFKDVTEAQLMHTSRFSMGVDAADLNNDGFNEIISLDMLPERPDILKRSENDEDISLFKFKLDYGYNYQYSRNALQLNNGNGCYSEIAMYSGIHATDWSWSPLFFDMDQDGKQDLFISNGIPKRMNDLDYINFVSDQDWQWKTSHNELSQKELDLIAKIPELKLENKIFIQGNELQFTDRSMAVKNILPSYSSGAAYADFDNDGDLDVVVNNINEKPFIYKNEKGTTSQKNRALRVKLKGPATNIMAIGARLIAMAGGKRYFAENYPVRGFQSSSQEDVFIGIGSQKADSICIVWPDQSYECKAVGSDSIFNLSWTPGLPKFDYRSINKNLVPASNGWKDVAAEVGLHYQHHENPYIEFHREPLVPFSCGEDGPAVCVGDINGDNRDDIYFGASKTFKSELYLQQANGRFVKSPQKALEADSTYEDTDALLVDVNKDGHPDLVVASGGNEYSLKNDFMAPRLYLNDGKGNFAKATDALGEVRLNASTVKTGDLNNDGHADLIFFGRSVPYQYAAFASSYILINRGNGTFEDKTAQLAPEFKDLGLVTAAELVDMDGDKDLDIVAACEWDGIKLFTNEGGKWKSSMLYSGHGWWSSLFISDFDGDGNPDVLAGNQGLNTRMKASPEKPVRMYYADMDNNGTKEQIVTYYIGEREIPLANKTELEKKLPPVKKKFLKASDFAKADVKEILSFYNLKNAQKMEVNQYANLVIFQQAKGQYNASTLPSNMQYAPLTAAASLGKNEWLIGMNKYNSNVQIGRYDADFGGIFTIKGKEPKYQHLPGLLLKGAIKKILPIQVNGNTQYLVVKNNESCALLAR